MLNLQASFNFIQSYFSVDWATLYLRTVSIEGANVVPDPKIESLGHVTHDVPFSSATSTELARGNLLERPFVLNMVYEQCKGTLPVL